MSDLIKIERRPDGVVWVTLNRPEARNALSRQTNIELFELANELDQEEDVRPIVITGAGDQAFCAGADLKERRGVSAEESLPYLDAIASAIEAWARLRRPTIAAMNGSAYGGGLELALACDLRVIVEGAELGLTEVRLGIMPGAGGTQRLPRLIGVPRAKEMIMLGRRIPASKALEYGLVNQVAPASGLRAAVDGILAELAGCAPLSVTVAKQAIQRGIEVSIDQGVQIERDLYELTLSTDDRNEGLAAFAEKRPPRFTGR
jgi:methylglutaconyl-CoA hydratase